MDEARAVSDSDERARRAMFMPHLPDVTALTHSMGMIVHRRRLSLVRRLADGSTVAAYGS
ncbi:hypothetical protein [Paraburkholderia dilworthii]|uniref:hypothetical protein n=1 Tax=Paraburkholderia dilworthii TaxID=948106 RepID=UPI0004106194|nr:hypothetical protein [Paraburkholderia dilworthii]